MNNQEIKQIRLKAGLTQDQLAKLFKLSSQNYVSKLESGIYKPSKQLQFLYSLLKDGKIKIDEFKKG